MDSERWKQIEGVLQSVLDRPSEERDAFLRSACAGDEEMEREVRSLLTSERRAGAFLEGPAIAVAARAIQSAPQLLEDSTLTELCAGTCLGPYRIESKLGEGGMGEVFRATDTRLGRAVAIKIVREPFSGRFEREARAISSLNHPNICTLYDVGPNYLVMELVEGETLATVLKQGPLSLERVRQYGEQIAAALGEAHAKGIVHRDLKPGNIMIAKSGVKVLDFGLAKSGQDETLTATRGVMGTPGYMAPEQREGKPADARSDIYSFGCVLYEMATGQRAGPQRRPIAPRRLERIVSRCLEEDPERRWQSPAELGQELAAITVSRSPGKRLVPAAAAVIALAMAGYLYLHRPPKLTDKDTIVLADFVNNTGDPIFDGTLRQGLAIQLEQSPFLKIMDDEQVQRILRLMSLPPGARISNPIAHEICVREGAAATIDGTIASLGKDYVLTLQATACQGGATLAREQIQAADKEHVLSAVGTAATAMRGKLGESLNSIEKLNRPLEQATTASLEALQSYTAGFSEMKQGHFLASVPLFERATALDPNFASAYASLGTAFNNAGDTAKEREYARKAFALIDRVSEFERDVIAASYYGYTGELDKAIDAYRLGIRNYPRYWGFHNNLSEVQVNLGQYEEGLRGGLEATRLQPNVEPPYRRQLDAYMCLDRLAEARQLREKLRVMGLGGARIHQRFLELAYVDGDAAAIDRETQWFAGKPDEYLSLGLQGAYRNVVGQRSESHRLFQRAAEAARRHGLRNVASEFEEADAQDDALTGNCQTARSLGRAALALAMCGDAAQAEKLAAETTKLFPNGTIWNAVQLPEIRAAIALQRGQPAQSVELLASASPYERSYLEATYLRGLAYLRLQKGAGAAAEFQKIVDHKGANWGSRWQHPYWGQVYSLSYLGVARGWALAGDTAKGRKAFEDFFELWKDADPGIPVLEHAKAEYARLK
jgi:tetratricopeptide (TPR) repeat protein/predicted Ser/Thr protein kinase